MRFEIPNIIHGNESVLSVSVIQSCVILNEISIDVDGLMRNHFNFLQCISAELVLEAKRQLVHTTRLEASRQRVFRLHLFSLRCFAN